MFRKDLVSFYRELNDDEIPKENIDEIGEAIHESFESLMKYLMVNEKLCGFFIKKDLFDFYEGKIIRITQKKVLVLTYDENGIECWSCKISKEKYIWNKF